MRSCCRPGECAQAMCFAPQSEPEHKHVCSVYRVEGHCSRLLRCALVRVPGCGCRRRLPVLPLPRAPRLAAPPPCSHPPQLPIVCSVGAFETDAQEVMRQLLAAAESACDALGGTADEVRLLSHRIASHCAARALVTVHTLSTGSPLLVPPPHARCVACKRIRVGQKAHKA